jgi:molybdopterin molybdotransferase
MEFLRSIAASAALNIILSFPVNLEKEMVEVGSAQGRVLAEDIVAGEDTPPFTRSLVDGFAVKAKDVAGAKETTPVLLAVKGDVKVGEESRVAVGDGQSVHVSTGAMLPEGGDSVVMEEYVRRLPEAIEVTRGLYRGENVCYQGEDIKRGNRVLAKGARITPFAAGILAALGESPVSVWKRPKIGLLSSGDEIVGIEEMPLQGMVRDINRYTLSSMLVRTGATAEFLGIARDTLEDIVKTLESARGCDIIVVSGGSSKGEKDFITVAVEALGGEILFHGINIKPGRPTIFGRIWEKPFFGLPGHPYSCAMVMLRFVLPLVRRMMGASPQEGLKVKGVLATNLPSQSGVEEYVRVILEEGEEESRVTPLFAKSAVISSLAQASGYVIVPASREGYENGEEVEVHLFG